MKLVASQYGGCGDRLGTCHVDMNVLESDVASPDKMIARGGQILSVTMHSNEAKPCSDSHAFPNHGAELEELCSKDNTELVGSCLPPGVTCGVSRPVLANQTKPESSQDRMEQESKRGATV